MNTGFSTTIQGRGAVDIVALLYDGGLIRTPEAGGLDGFTTAVQNGATYQNVADAIVSSPEFAAIHAGQSDAQIINSFYVASLGREAEPAGLNYYLNSGMSLSQILLTITTSTESLNYNNVGLDRFEIAAANGQVDGAMAGGLDNTPTPPTIVEVPGPTQIVTVPGPTQTVYVDRPVDTPDVHAESFGTLNAALTNGTGGFYFGDGTTRANGNVLVQDTSEGHGLTVAFAVHPRQAAGDGSGKFAPDNVVLDGNEAHATYHVPGGTQTTATGSFQDVANRGAFNVALTVGTLDGTTLASQLASGHKVVFSVDQDASAATQYLDFSGYIDTNGLMQFRNEASGAAITDNRGTASVVSNSEQINFFLPGGVAALTPGSQYDLKLTAYAADGHVLASVHDTLILGQPGTLDGTHLYA